MSSTVSITISGSIAGAPEGSATPSLTITNSTGVVVTAQQRVASTGIAGASTFTNPSTANSRMALIIPGATAGSDHYLLYGNSTANASSANCVAISATAATLLSVVGRTSSIGIWTTGTTGTTANPIRVTWL